MNGYGVVYVGIELSVLFCFENGGEMWIEFKNMKLLLFFYMWVFLFRFFIYYVCWIIVDLNNFNIIYVLIEVGVVI